MTITRPGEGITEERVLGAIRDGQRVAHSIARYLNNDVPDDGVIAVIYQHLDTLELRGEIWRDQLGLYHEFIYGGS